MKLYSLIFGLFTVFTLVNPTHATSLTEIAAFSKEVCDEIATEGHIRRENIEGQLNGKLSGVAKLLGASVGVNGKIMIDDTTYKGIPYSALPNQMTDARECRKQLTLVLLKERQEVERIRVERLSQESEEALACQTSLSCEQSKMEGLCQCREVVEEIAEEKGFSERQQSQIYFKHCGSKLRGIKDCWADGDLNLQRANCDAVLAASGLSAPEIPPNSCLGQNR